MKTYELNDFVPKLEHIIAREICRSTLEQICHKQRLSHAGIMSIDIPLMFKNIVLQAIYKLCFEQKALQIRDRLSFRDILDLEFADTLPDM